MHKKKAINIINKQICKLKSLNDPKEFGSEWLLQTGTYIDTLFGIDSAQSQKIKSCSVGSKYSTDLTPFLNDCIEIINDIGVYKKPKNNFLFTMPNWLAMLLFPLMLTIGIAIGNIQPKSNQVNKSTNTKNSLTTRDTSYTKSLTDSISSPRNNSN